MKVSLATHGGQIASVNLRRPPRVVDSSSLPAREAEELAHLVAAAKASPPAHDVSQGLARDSMSYTITIEDGYSTVTLEQSDMTASSAFIALRNWIKAHLVASPRRNSQ
jgi:hypothetical protein